MRHNIYATQIYCKKLISLILQLRFSQGLGKLNKKLKKNCAVEKWENKIKSQEKYFYIWADLFLLCVIPYRLLRYPAQIWKLSVCSSTLQRYTNTIKTWSFGFISGKVYVRFRQAILGIHTNVNMKATLSLIVNMFT